MRVITMHASVISYHYSGMKYILPGTLQSLVGIGYMLTSTIPYTQGTATIGRDVSV